MRHVVVNPSAGLLRQRPDLLVTVARQVRGRASLWVPRDLEELETAARGIVRRPGPIALCGGDGTFMAGLSALCRVADDHSLPPIAFVAGGTVATVARAWGTVDGVGAALDRWLRLPARPATCQRSTLRIEDEAGMVRHGFTLGTGLVTRFFREYYRRGATGLPLAATIFARTYLGSLAMARSAGRILAPLPCTLVVNHTPRPSRAYSLVVSSVLRNVGLGLHVTYRAGQDPDRLHLVATSLPARRLGPQAGRVLMGRPLRGPDVVDQLVREFRLDFPSDRLGSYVLDGELLQARWVRVAVGRRIDVVTVPGP